VVGQEDAVHLEVGAVAVEALEAIVVAGASGVAEAQEASVSAVAVVAAAAAVEGSEEVVVVSGGHDMYLRHALTPRNFKNAWMVEISGKWRRNSKQSFEDGLSRFECNDFLFDVLKSLYSLLLGLYGLQ
jgi:spermidine synthase